MAPESTVHFDAETEVQPDALLFRDPASGGTARITEDGYIEGPPQLVVEVAASSASYDLHDKLRVYERTGVPEYIVWRVLDNALDWLRLREGRFERVEPDANGVIESAAFAVLRLAVDRTLTGDHAGVLAALDQPRTPPPPGDTL